MYKKFFKRLFDIIISLIALPFFFIILLVIPPLIYFSDKGSIFYNAPRLGKDGKIFKMYKFRSMKMNVPDIRNEDGSTFNKENDPRLTKIGKFLRKTSIDEIPQILNVIKGEMSIIGPRPDLIDFKNYIFEQYPLKFTVRPGITGYNQAYFRNSSELSIKFMYDEAYVKELNLVLDLKIFVKTIEVIIRRKNIYKN